jgi:formylglycine-generating enzyme required for sulfatase activity
MLVGQCLPIPPPPERTVVTVHEWNGKHATELRRALRQSISDFADNLGVNERTVSKWGERGSNITLRPITQASLDDALAKAPADAQRRFAASVELPWTLAAPRDTGDTEVPQLIRYLSDGKAMAHVPAGVFPSGDRGSPVWLAAFYIDVYPVTNAEYQNFVAATGARPPQHWHADAPPAELTNHPVVHVTFGDAAAYAAWAGKHLPSALQWEKAARGEAGSRYPWGDQATHAKCNTRESQIGRTTPVNCYHSGTSAYGVYDLAGNVWEWCATETSPDRRVLKGSAFTSPFIMAEGAAVNDASTRMSDDDTGFRCILFEHGVSAPRKH